MSEEIFDVVDERDEVTGQRTRAAIHRLRLRHRSAHLLVFNRAGQVLLQKRDARKDCNPGLWDTSVAGHVDHGESYGACVVREAREELDLALPAVPAFLFKLDASALTGWEFSCIYRVVADGPFRPDAGEIECIAWFGVDAVTRWFERTPSELTGTLGLIWRRLDALV